MQAVERHIRAWLASFVVELELCPFAQPLLEAHNLRITVSRACSPEQARLALLQELDVLQQSTEKDVATTLLAFPGLFADFEDYLDFLDEAQGLLAEAGLEGLVQIASFHPNYQFHGETADAPANFSNRTPYPILHLLREGMLTRVLEDFPEPDQIPVRNVRVLEALGREALEVRWRDLFKA